jgi:FtsH-binding integral membrane protein
MISVLDFLYLTLVVAIIITTIFVNMILYNTWKVVKSFRISTEHAFSFTTQILKIKQKTKLAILKTLSIFLKKINSK